LKELFSDVRTTTHILKHEIKLTSSEAVCSKPYNLVEPVEKKSRKLERQGWIESSDAVCASPIVVVNNIRLCVNYKRWYDITVNDSMPIAKSDDILTIIGQ